MAEPFVGSLAGSAAGSVDGVHNQRLVDNKPEATPDEPCTYLERCASVLNDGEVVG